MGGGRGRHFAVGGLTAVVIVGVRISLEERLGGEAGAEAGPS